MWPDRADAGAGANTVKHGSRWLLFIKADKLIAAQMKASKILISCPLRKARFRVKACATSKEVICFDWRVKAEMIKSL